MDYVVGLGSNLGSRRASLRAALELLENSHAGRVERVSRLYESDAVGPPQPRYFNAAARVSSTLEAHAFLHALLSIEARLGRRRRERWGARTLDLDILWGQTPVSEPGLCVPHARLCERAFALAPLLDVAPELASEYAQTLAALGGPPETLGFDESARLTESPLGFEVAAEGPDFADALADALGALGRRLDGTAEPARGCEVRVVRAPAAAEPAVLARAVLLHAARDFALARCTLGEACDDGHQEAHLIGHARAAPTSGGQFVALTRTRLARAERVTIAVAG